MKLRVVGRVVCKFYGGSSLFVGREGAGRVEWAGGVARWFCYCRLEFNFILRKRVVFSELKSVVGF